VKRLLALMGVVIIPALSQIEHGSVGVVYFTDKKIVMAADSRVTRGSIQSDDECKVSAFDRQVIFVSTGATGARSSFPVAIPSWKNSDVARASYNRIVQRYSTPRGHVLELAVDFAESLRSDWSNLAMYDLIGVTRVVSQGALTAALIGGKDGDGSLQLFMVLITFNPSTIVGPVGEDVQSISNCDLKNFCAVGEISVPVEFLSGISDRAKAEARNWKPTHSVNPRDIDIARTMRQVELSIRYNQENDVGGQIDAVQLSRTGRSRWYRRKSNCPAD